MFVKINRNVKTYGEEKLNFLLFFINLQKDMIKASKLINLNFYGMIQI